MNDRLAEQLAGLTPAQRAVLELKLRERRAGAPRIGKRHDPSTWEMSFAQQRLWFVEQLQPAGAANHISAAIRVEGPLNLAALERGLNEILERHEVLRCGYIDRQGQPVQRPGKPATFSLLRLDLDPLPPDRRDEETRRLAKQEADRPFDLTTGPLLRASLIRRAGDDSVLVVVVHHIAADGWSMGILARELSTLYAAFLDSETSPWPVPSIQYADFAAWQRTQVGDSQMSAQREWWRTKLQGLPVLDMPTDRPRPAVPSFAGGRESIGIPRELSAAVSRLSQLHGVTPFMTLLAAFQVLLARWTGQTDVGVGSPVAGRNWREVEGLIGLFVNTLVLRSDLSGNPRFADLLREVRSGVTAALSHQDVPFERLVEDLQIERTLSQAPLTPVVFAFQNVPDASLVLAGTRTTVFEFERTTSRFDLCLFVAETPEGMRASAEYRTDLFEAGTIRRFLRCYLRLLECVVVDPQQPIASVPLLDGRERDQVLAAWNATERAYPKSATIHGLVAQHASSRPDSAAVVCGSSRLTYGELDRRANQLARALVKRGIGPGSLVGLSVDRSLNLIVTLVGILKSGAAYVPLDPGYPAERLTYMASHAALSMVVAGSRAANPVPAGEALYLDEWERCIACEAPTDPGVDVTADDLAYISFTSGSTGLPKGVEVCHKSVIRLLCDGDYATLGPDETFLQLAPVAFDASTFEIWGALVHGGRLVVYPARRPELDELGRVLHQEAVTTMWLTSSLYNAVINEDPLILSGLRQLLIGGEALSVEHVRRGLEALSQTTIINGYGPTEGTTFTCCHRISRSDVEHPSGSIPIGRPIACTRVFVLDSFLEPVPVGVPGELYIGGDGLARGYVRSPALTAARFVPDALSGRPGARLYRTGDVVRYREDGTIEFLGRRDHQVKLRGYRIELGEIETALTRHPAIQSAIASVWQEPSGDGMLVAHYVGVDGVSLLDADLRAFLKERLPDYMVPATFVRLAGLPLTGNGKIDRDALPAPELITQDDTVLVAPRNEVEEIIVEECRALLAVPRVGVFDNFFDLGGHSLLATQLASRLKRAFQTDVSVRMIFESRTLAELADGVLEKLIDV